MTEIRKIIHIDMDAFFASVEQRDRPELRGKPVIVGGSAERRGVVSTCSYEARVFGVHSAMPTRTARRLCPQAVFLEGNMRKYAAASKIIMKLCRSFTPVVEQLSIDEAYLDVTENLRNQPSATLLARDLQQEIFEATGLTASAGVSYNKFLAKVASDMKKPAGLFVIPPDAAEPFLETLPVEKFYGIGKVSAAKLRRMNVRTGRDLKALSRELLTSIFGKNGIFYYHIVRGIDERAVETEYERKSYGRESTFQYDVLDERKIRIHLRAQARNIALQLQKHSLFAGNVTLKVKYSDFQTATRTIMLPRPCNSGERIGDAAVRLIARTEIGRRPVRLVGVAASNFGSPEPPAKPRQLEFDFMASLTPSMTHPF